MNRHGISRRAAALAVVLSLCAAIGCSQASGHLAVAENDARQAQQHMTAASFSNETFNGHPYKLFVPGSYQAGTAIPLVVMLHGCTQDPDSFAAGSGMNGVADQVGFAVLYPQQPAEAHPNKCWNWFRPGDQARGQGEPAMIVGMVEQVRSRYAIDPGAVYVAGLSAGGAMSVVLGATYPDVFAAVGVGAGLEYLAATTESAAWTAMSKGGPDPVALGKRIYQGMAKAPQVVPMIVFHGATDRTVNPLNADQIVTQWVTVNNLSLQATGQGGMDDKPDATERGQAAGGLGFTRYVYKDSDGQTRIEKYLVEQMGHAWPGGPAGGSFTEPRGPNASQLVWAFFQGHRRPLV